MENTLLNMIPSSYIPEVHLSQYDVGRTIPFKLMDGNSEYSVPSGANIKILATKPSGLGFEVACTFSGNIVTLVNTETMSNEAGRFRAELRITSGNVILGTSNFIMNVERSPHPEGTIDGDAEALLPELTLLVERIENSNARIESMTATATTLATGEDATAEYDPTNNQLVLGLPRGEQGEGVASLEPRVSANENAINVLDARMNTFASLPEGSTSGNAELLDIRVAYDGKTYPSAGDAVRGQTSNIKPMQLNRNKKYYPISDIDGITSESGYCIYTAKGSLPNVRSSLQHFVVPVASGDVIQCHVMNTQISSVEEKSFFCPVDSDGKCTAWDINLTLIDATNFIYQLTAPSDCANIYITYATNASPWVKLCEGEFNIDWLKLTTNNFDNAIIPESAIIGRNEHLYGDSLKKPFDFNGKNGQALGDSISAGVCSPNLGTTTPFIRRFADSVGISVLSNLSISGSCIADPNDQNSILNRALNISTARDFFFIAGGTNDFNTSKELGTFASTDTSTFYGALKTICNKFATDFPDATVIFITPIPYTEAFFDIRPELKNGNALGYTLNDYRNAIYEVATSYGFNVVDGSSLGMPIGKGGWSNTMCDDSDGCHPTIAGHELYARNLQGKLL